MSCYIPTYEEFHERMENDPEFELYVYRYISERVDIVKLIEEHFGVSVIQDPESGYINIGAFLDAIKEKGFGSDKSLEDYLELPSTKRFLEVLAEQEQCSVEDLVRKTH